MAQRKHIETQTEWEARMAGKVLEQVKSELFLDLPFMGIALGTLLPAAKEELSTFATDGRIVWYPPQPLMRLFRTNVKFLDRAYLHTVLHCVFSHLWIGGQRNRQLWGLACDIAVEYTIDGIDRPCTRRILSYIRKNTYEELQKLPHGISAATIYMWILEQDAQKRQAMLREFHTDDHRFWPQEQEGQTPKSQSQDDQAKWRQVARQTRMEQKRKGSDQSEGERLMAAMLSANKSQRSYREFLRQFAVLREEIHADPDEFDLSYYTYGLRHYGNMPLIEPLESREFKKIREFVVVLDTSYSTSGDLIKSFLRETYTLLTQTDSFFTRCQIRLIQCDDRIRMDEVIHNEREMDALLKRFTVVGGGGTDFRPPFAWVNQLLEEGELKNLCGLLYFTDGKGTYPKKRPAYKTAFLFVGPYDHEQVPPWALQLRLEPAEFIGEMKVHDLAKGDGIFRAASEKSIGADGNGEHSDTANAFSAGYQYLDMEDELYAEELPNT